MKNGLVLEGGALRGLFTAGVLDVFLEKDVRFDGMVGVSVGRSSGAIFSPGSSEGPSDTMRGIAEAGDTRAFCRSFSREIFTERNSVTATYRTGSIRSI